MRLTKPKRFFHYPRSAPLSFNFRCTKRDFSALSDDYREKLRNGLTDIKLEDAVGLFSEMVKSRPLPSIIEFTKLFLQLLSTPSGFRYAC